MEDIMLDEQPNPKESKRDRFRRVMERRLNNALEDLRLISQCSSHHYEWDISEATTVVNLLDASLKQIAKTYSVPFYSQVGQPKTSVSVSKIDEVDVAKAIAFISQNQNDKAVDLLIKALNQQPRN
jgi:hypothetical protein